MGVRIVGSMLVRNEDRFIEQAVRNVAAFCDRIHVLDHVSDDRTSEILAELGREFDHLDLRRHGNAGASHDVLEPYAGSLTWVLRVDGDELYDAAGLDRTRELLEAGELSNAFRVQANVLHCVRLNRATVTATGYLSPPSRPITSLFNFAAVTSWSQGTERLHGGTPVFRAGYDWHSVAALHERYAFDDSPLRYLHACFLRRSSLDPEQPGSRLSLAETGIHRRGLRGRIRRMVRGAHVGEASKELQRHGRNWKLEKYRRGALVERDATPFFPEPALRSRSLA